MEHTENTGWREAEMGFLQTLIDNIGHPDVDKLIDFLVGLAERTEFVKARIKTVRTHLRRKHGKRWTQGLAGVEVIVVPYEDDDALVDFCRDLTAALACGARHAQCPHETGPEGLGDEE
jgi:hypothetical protein